MNKIIPKIEDGISINKVLPYRLENIEFIKNLPRNNLKYAQNEARILIHETKKGEKIYIQYPGQESERPGKNHRPWDFRPKIISDNKEKKDYTFGEIWGLIHNLFRFDFKNDDIYYLELIACEFYRIAFMLDYEELDPTASYISENIHNDSRYEIIVHNKFHRYTPRYDIIEKIENRFPNIDGMSWEAFFCYNDLLALNEDCKYYYSKLPNTSEASEYIKAGTGRLNTIRTYLFILSFIEGNYSLQKLIDSFHRVKMCPISNRDCNEFLKNYMY